MAPSMASVPLLMKNEFCRSPGVTSASTFASAPRQRLEQLLAVERHAPELVGHRLDDLGMVDAGAEDAVAAQAVDVLAAQQVVRGSSPAPLHSRAANWPAWVTDFR